jgi:NitT/TauT family transport system substrate-binding protein
MDGSTTMRGLATAALALALCAPAHADAVKVGISKLIGYPAVPVAIEHGYFKAEGLDVEMVYFDSAQPIAVAVASGDVDFGVAGMSAGFYTLAAQGQLRLVASSGGDAPGFYNLAFLASNKAYDAGLKTPRDLRGHSIAITQVGTSLHYAIGQAAMKEGFAMSDVTVKPLQSNSNVISALTGNTVDAAVLPGAPILMPMQRGEIKLLAWAADVAPNLTGSAAFVSTKAANTRGDMVKKFMVAYRKGMRDFHDAFVGPDGKRHDEPTAPAMLALMSNFTGVAPEEIERAIPYIDPDGRIDAASVAGQIAWYKSQNLLKGDIKAEDLIDSRYALEKVANR